VDRAIKMKKMNKRNSNEKFESRTSRQFSFASTNNNNHRRLSRETSKTEEVNFKFDTSRNSKRLENRVKFSNIRDSITIEKPVRSRIAGSISVYRNSRQARTKYQKCMGKLLKVDSVIAIICLILFVFNAHYILFLNVYVKKIKTVNVNNGSLLDQLWFSNMAENEDVLNSLKKCTVETGTSYDVFLQFLWWWIDMSKIFIFLVDKIM
jgi:hypothetical protein